MNIYRKKVSFADRHETNKKIIYSSLKCTFLLNLNMYDDKADF